MRAAKGKPSLVEERFMQKCRTFEISTFSNEDRLNLRTVSEYTRKRLEKKVDERHGWVLKEKTTELHTHKWLIILTRKPNGWRTRMLRGSVPRTSD